MAAFGAVIVVMLLATAPAGARDHLAPQAQSAAVVSAESPSARAIETRLRKLHLVRPDLIPYPLCYEVYC